MTDKQFIEMLKNIKEYCKKTSCIDCQFNEGHCAIQKLAFELRFAPLFWNIEEIERIIND